MIKENLIWMGNTEKGESISILPNMINRHGLVCGATGTGKTVTLKVLAESLSDLGVPVFMADVKGDIAGLSQAGEDNENMQKRIEKFGLKDAGFTYHGYPTTFWDIYGKTGIPLRATISEVGPLMLSRILDLNDLQSDILSVVFKIADDNHLLLIDTKDLKAILNYVDENKNDFQADYGKISSSSLGVITRAVVSLESSGGDVFFGEPALNITDWFSQSDGKGMIHILDSSSLINNPKLYSSFLLWMLSELFETLPEVGDLDKPKMVFFFDEAHLLFDDISKDLEDKIEQVVKLIRSKGVGVYFCTQNPKDIPDGVLAQLGNKIEHGLHAYTPADQKGVKAAAESFRVNPEFDTYEAIQNLGTGQAIVSFLDEKGVPGIAQQVDILPPQSLMSSISDTTRDQIVKGSLLYSKYATAVDNDSAYEFLQRKGLEDQAKADQQEKENAAAKEKEKADKEAAKQKEKEEKAAQKEKEKAEKAEQKAAEKAQKEKERAMKQVGSTLMGTVGRQVGKELGKNFGTFGQQLGGNVGASIGRGILKNLFSK